MAKTISYQSLLLRSTLFIVMVFSLSRADLTFDVPEEEGSGYLVGNLAAGLELPGDASTRFQFATNTLPNETFFTLNEISGELRTTRPIDREAICPDRGSVCQLMVGILVRGERIEVVNVFVNILDMNDHAPIFSEEVVNLEISESVASGTRYPLELADDPDVGNNTIQSYELSEDFDGLFELIINTYSDNSKSIQLKIVRPLDRELRSDYAFYLVAKDFGTPQRSGNAMLNITVLDSNDNSPKFERTEYTVDIDEDWPVGVTFVTVRASDADAGTNGQIIYDFSSSVSSTARMLFDIDSDTGDIKTIGRLDYETAKSYQLSIKAINKVSNPVPDFTIVTVNLRDINDNKPTLHVTPIDGEGRRTNLTELTSPGTEVAFVSVSDRDSEVNGEISLSLMYHYDSFELIKVSDGQYFILTSEYLDREEISVYNISIIAEDHGNPTMFRKVRLIVFVDDINDNPPVFIPPIIEASVSENRGDGYPIVTVEAFDADVGMNAFPIYSLLSGTDMFSIDPMTGEISVIEGINREEYSRIQFLVQACDQGEEPKCTNTTVIVTIEDENDNAPIFEEFIYEFTIDEGNDLNDIIATDLATDIDTGINAEIVYSIPSDAQFRIDSSKGEIFSRKSLDYEEMKTYSFIVTATDGGDPAQSASATVVVTLRDINDNAPTVRFPNPSDFTRFIPLKATEGFFIAQINATDVDRGRNSRLSYSLKDGNTYGTFGVNAKGQILTAKQIRKNEEGVYNLTIRVSDSGIPPLNTDTVMRVAIANQTFNVSLPPTNFTRLFNLTLSNFTGAHLRAGGSTSNPAVADWLMMIVIALAGIAVFLLILFLLVASTKCRKKQHPSRKYDVPNKSNGLYATSQARSTSSDIQSKYSDTDSALLSAATSQSSIPSKNIMKWRQQAEDQRQLPVEQETASQRNSMGDARLGNSKMSTFSNDMQDSALPVRQPQDPDAEVQRLLDKLRHTTNEMSSDHSSEGDGRSSHDSGHGDSDRDTRDVATTTIPRVSSGIRGSPSTMPSGSKRSTSLPVIAASGNQHRNNVYIIHDSPVGQPSYNYRVSPRCTPECQTLGHGDQCWSPTPRMQSGSTVPKAKSVHFSPDGTYYHQDHNANSRTGPRASKPQRGPSPAEAAALLQRLRQTPLPQKMSASQGDVSRRSDGNQYDDPRKVNASSFHLSPIREHPQEVSNKQKRYSDPHRRGLPTNTNSLPHINKRLHSSLSTPPTYNDPRHQRTPSFGESNPDELSYSSNTSNHPDDVESVLENYHKAARSMDEAVRHNKSDGRRYNNDWV